MSDTTADERTRLALAVLEIVEENAWCTDPEVNTEYILMRARARLEERLQREEVRNEWHER